MVREDVVIGDRVTLHAGAVIGSDGFGFVPLPDGHRKIPQVGTVILEDDVEIGANATVDRATLGATRIGRGTKIDNLVMIGHGCRSSDRAACWPHRSVWRAARASGAGVMMGGQAGASGHLIIGDGAQIAAQSGVHREVPAGAVYGGYPAIEVRRWRRVSTAMVRLPELFRRLRRVEKALGMARTGATRTERPFRAARSSRYTPRSPLRLPHEDRAGTRSGRRPGRSPTWRMSRRSTRSWRAAPATTG